MKNFRKVPEEWKKNTSFACCERKEMLNLSAITFMYLLGKRIKEVKRETNISSVQNFSQVEKEDKYPKRFFFGS